LARVSPNRPPIRLGAGTQRPHKKEIPIVLLHFLSQLPIKQSRRHRSSVVYHLRIGIRWRSTDRCGARTRASTSQSTSQLRRSTHTRGDQLTPPDKEPSNGRGVSKTPNRHLSPPSLPPCGAAFDGALRSAPRGPPPLSPSSPPLPCAPVVRSACAGLPLQPALRLASPCAHPEGRGGLARLPLREKRLELRHAVLRVREEVRLDLERRSEAGAGRRVAHLVARRERTGRGDARLLPRLDILAHHEELLTARVGATSEGRVLWLGTRGRPPSLPSARSGTRAARPGRFAGG